MEELYAGFEGSSATSAWYRDALVNERVFLGASAVSAGDVDNLEML